MRRNTEIKIRLSKAEFDNLMKKVRKTNYSREGFCRKAIIGAELREAPPADFPELIKLMRRIESKLNDLLQIESRKGRKDTDEIHSLLEEIRKMDTLIWTAFT